mgnify:CR=1 FL=1
MVYRPAESYQQGKYLYPDFKPQNRNGKQDQPNGLVSQYKLPDNVLMVQVIKKTQKEETGE